MPAQLDGTVGSGPGDCSIYAVSLFSTGKLSASIFSTVDWVCPGSCLGLLRMSELSRRLGEAVRVLRERRGLSQESLAAQAGVHRSTVLKVENDDSAKAGPALDTVERLARGLNLTPSDLIAYADGSEDPEDEDE